MAKRWVMLRDDDHVLLGRAGRLRFDLCQTVELPHLRPEALAHEVRKDVWRALQRLRGFSPVIRVTRVIDGVRLEAGGHLDRPSNVNATDLARLSAVIDDPAHRARWIQHARLK